MSERYQKIASAFANTQICFSQTAQNVVVGDFFFFFNFVILGRGNFIFKVAHSTKTVSLNKNGDGYTAQSDKECVQRRICVNEIILIFTSEDGRMRDKLWRTYKSFGMPYSRAPDTTNRPEHTRRHKT
jgi:hypothetical protein